MHVFLNLDKNKKIMGSSLWIFPQQLEILQKELSALFDLVEVSFHTCYSYSLI